MKNKRFLIPIIMFIVMIMLSYFTEIDSVKIYSIGIFIIALYMWIDGSIPISITTILLICIMPIFNIMSFNDAINNISVNTSLFILASSGLTIAISNSNIPNYIVSRILNKTDNSKVILFCIAIVITMISGFMSSLATCTLFYGILSTSFKESKKTNFYKILMLLVPVCSSIGGFVSPAGTPANILIIDELAKLGITLSFVKWFSIGFPFAIFTSLLVLLFSFFTLKPESKISSNKKVISLNSSDKIIALISFFIIFGWFFSSYISVINTTLIACLGLFVFFIPSLNILNMKKMSYQTNWDLVISMGTVSVLMVGINRSGVLNDIISYFIPKISSLNIVFIFILISLFICFLRSIIPTTTAVVTFFMPMLLTLVTSLNVNPLYFMLILGYHSACSLILIYTEPIYLITYSENVYNEEDLLKIGLIPSIIMSIAVALLFPILL